jgi:hypothetical protein
MLWLGIWVHPYAEPSLEGSLDFWKFGVRTETKRWCNDMLSLKTTVDWIPHPYHIFRKYFSTLVYYDWAYGCALMLVRHLKQPLIFGKLGVGLRPSDGVTTWLRLKTAVDCIPHPYNIHRKYFSTLIYYDWAYGCTFTLICHLRGVWIFGILGLGLRPSDSVMTWLMLQKRCGLHPTSISFT